MNSAFFRSFFDGATDTNSEDDAELRISFCGSTLKNKVVIIELLPSMGLTSFFFDFASFPLETCSLPFLSVF